jgi:hypothetical protein
VGPRQASNRLKKDPPCPILWPVLWDKGWDSTNSEGIDSRRQRPAGLLKESIGRTREPAKSQSDANPRKARTACFIHSWPEQGLEIDQVGPRQASNRLKKNPPCPILWPVLWDKGWDSTNSEGIDSRRQRPAGLLKESIGRTREPATSQSDANPRKARTACFIHSWPEQGLEINQVGPRQASDRLKKNPPCPILWPVLWDKGWDSTNSEGIDSRRQRPAGLLKESIGRTREPATSQSDANPQRGERLVSSTVGRSRGWRLIKWARARPLTA